MPSRDRQILPSSFELWCVSLTSLALLVAGNAKLFLQRYGLIGSSAVVHQQLTSKVSSGLSVIDSFTLTPTIVTFITWGVIGLVVFSLVQAVVRATGVVKFERDLSSNRYVHPMGFNRESYWKRIITDTIWSFVLLGALIAGAIMYLLFVVPMSFDYAQRFLLHVSFSHLLDLLAGLFMAFAGTTLLYLLLKLTIWHHRLAIR